MQDAFYEMQELAKGNTQVAEKMSEEKFFLYLKTIESYAAWLESFASKRRILLAKKEVTRELKQLFPGMVE